MKKYINLFKFMLFTFAVVGMTSCLENGLDDLPAFEDAEISNIFVEHRYENPEKTWTDGSNIVEFQRLGMTKRIVSAEESGAQLDSIVIVPSVPKPSGAFTIEERQKVTLENIVVYVNISTAASIVPLDDAPELGKPGNFTQPRKYRVTAADGKSYRDWVIVIKPLPVINQYEAEYASTGQFDHPAGGLRDFSMNKYLSSVNENTVTTDHSDLGSYGYSINLTVNQDNSVTVTQFNGDGVEIGEAVPGEENSYNPSTRTFTLNYRYMGGGGYRIISETLIID
ncbi:DUF4361 domain-containing protein [Puteibacter caeruleilacunae]|nr:DUF4361 domain-containing protein [Puteibacter caeruleilacunae]